MKCAMELGDLYDKVTHTTTPGNQIPPALKSLPTIRVVPRTLDDLLNLHIPALLQSAIALETLRVNARRVDGRIIGTGEADFTKGNSLYTLKYKSKTFQLVDVPGIEGDEGRYEQTVREAVAKAHLVFYVNGTNKKPEKATAEKIRSYLRRGTQVFPIVNVRGNADAYEFEEDRESMESHGGAANALKQTISVLELVLDKKVLLPGHCVQGLLAFSCLAINPKSGQTSIHPSRDKDLVIQQRNYLKHFESAKTMFEFSQIQAVAQILHAKLDTFEDDIIESNKVKVRELLIENLDVLQKALKEHQTFISRVSPEFEKCRESIIGAVQTFKRLITAGRMNLWGEFFNSLSERADEIVAENFGDNDVITKKMTKAFKSRQDATKKRLQEQLEEHLETLQSSVSQAMERLIQDVRRVEFQQRVAFDDGKHKVVYHAVQLDMDLGIKDWGSIAFDVGSYALIGAQIGSAFPGIGTAIGAFVGTVVGAMVSVMHHFTNKEKRIRKAQAQVQKTIDKERDQVMGELAGETTNLMKTVRKEVKDPTLGQIDAIYNSLVRPLNIIQQQIALMSRIRNQLETMPHGTIQAIHS